MAGTAVQQVTVAPRGLEVGGGFLEGVAFSVGRALTDFGNKGGADRNGI